MATYTAIPDSAVDPDSPLTSELVTALRDNPIAIAEGAAGAPSLAAGYANSAVIGGVGTYLFAVVDENTETVFEPGDTTAGSNLAAAGYQSITGATGTEGWVSDPSGTTAYSGTWMCMGYGATDTFDVNDYQQLITLWLRIA